MIVKCKFAFFDQKGTCNLVGKKHGPSFAQAYVLVSYMLTRPHPCSQSNQLRHPYHMHLVRTWCD